jgi:hypothetical protein
MGGVVMLDDFNPEGQELKYSQTPLGPRSAGSSDDRICPCSLCMSPFHTREDHDKASVETAQGIADSYRHNPVSPLAKSKKV